MIEQSSNELKIRRELGFEPLQNEKFQNQSIREDESKVGGVIPGERVGGACARSARDITGGIYCSVRIFCMKSGPKRVNAMLNRLVSMRRRRWSYFRRLKMRIHNFHKRGNRALPSTGMLTFVNKCCQHLTKSAPVNAHDGTLSFFTTHSPA